jgi:hypothetical protein
MRVNLPATNVTWLMAPAGWVTYWISRWVFSRVNISLFDRFGLSVLITAATLAALALLAGENRQNH